jgi:hypothetical protein
MVRLLNPFIHKSKEQVRRETETLVRDEVRPFVERNRGAFVRLHARTEIISSIAGCLLIAGGGCTGVSLQQLSHFHSLYYVALC